MLVLSRRPDEKVLLPTVPAVIKVISSQAGLTRLGIEAPSRVPILREELCRDAPALPTADPAGNDRPDVRNRLNNLNLGLALLRRQLGDASPVICKALDGLEQELRALRRQVAPGGAPAFDGLTEAFLVGGPGA